MFLEMTYDYSIVIPLTITVACSYGVRSFLTRESIYSLKLVRRGHYLPVAMHSSINELIRAKTVMDGKFAVVPATVAAQELADLLAGQPEARWFVLEEAGTVQAVLSRAEAAVRLSGGAWADDPGPERKGFIAVEGDATLLDVLSDMKKSGSSVAVVTSRRDLEQAPAAGVAGVLSKAMLADALVEANDMFSLQT
jgi:CIC family chloride channel protein